MRNIANKYKRHIAAFFVLNLIVEVVSPSLALALTSGPSQPEVQEFQAINVSDMVDPSTGDCSYNLPLMEVDGYPLNLSYRSGITMEQEATSVGIGWNMNAGSISRNMRGIPDDFNGESITKKMNVKENVSYGINIGVGGELFGIDALNANVSLGLTYNNYSGYDFVKKIGFTLSLGSNASVGFGITSSSDGLTLSPNLSLSAKMASDGEQMLKGSASLGTSFNSRSGMKELSLNASVSGSGVNKQNQKHYKGENLGNIGNGSSISFGSPTYVPQVTMPMHTNGVIGSFKLGGTLFGVDVTGNIGGNYSKQTLANKYMEYPAYGYLNLHNGQQSDVAMLDFNREKDGTFTEATTNLPIPNLTYDNFSVMGQGVGGSYRPYRSEIGYVYDSRASNTSESNNLGIEVSLGNVAQGGLDFVNTTVDGGSGKWIEDNAALSALGFSEEGYLGYEPAYFKEMGEMNVDDDALFSTIQEENAVRFKLNDQGSSIGLKKELIAENSTVFNINNKNKRTKRLRRNKLFSYLTVQEYQYYALQTTLFSQIAKYNGSSLSNGHHIAEVTTTKTDGTRYVYGLPVYNNYQKEASFNISGFSGGQFISGANLVQYAASDATESNNKGIDNFFTSTELPPFAYAYMLTAVLSPDYIDKTGNGPTADDAGTYTLFKYDLKVNDYQWRTPHSYAGQANYATLEPGLLTENMDNKASYVYGKKDIYYLTSVEGKNHIAKLSYSSRSDGLGVSGETGGTNPALPQKQLDNITLYAYEDYKLQQANPGYSAFIVKRANFRYNYEICPGTYNSNASGGGKLTLKEVNFTYGSSGKGVLSPYKFNYNLTVNGTPISYNPAANDRWGNYKPDNANQPNSKFPYTSQNKTLQDQNAALWSLKSIQLPSGGYMEIDYESDDYAYIQDRRAGEMFSVSGFGSSPGSVPGTQQLFTGSGANTYLFFRLKNNIVPTNFLSDYLEGIDKMYFRFYVNLNCGANSDIPALTNFNAGPYTGYEFVYGYAEIDPANSGTVNSAGVNYGYVKVKTVRQSKTNLTPENPISKTAWQMARLQTPKQAYSCVPNNTDPGSGPADIEGVFRAIADAGFIKNTIQFFQGYNGALKQLGYGQNFAGALSCVRLNNPDYQKLGGGLRVKKVTLRDKWDKMLSASAYNANQGFQYGQQYDYTTTQNGRVISSGVASYEPSCGADENPFHQPVFMEQHKAEALLVPDKNMYAEEPMGEMFFPSPNVVYSRVTVSNLVTGAGKTVNEYYTAKDFPTYVHSLGMDAKRKKPDPILSLFSFSTYDRFTGSQGYSIELNDMHGKPKAVHLYEEGAVQPVNTTNYKYRTENGKLSNTVKTVFKDGSIRDSRIGVDYDFYADFRENNTTTEAVGVQGNLYFMLVGIFPFTVGPILPTYHKEEIQLRTAVTNKVIYKYGILDKVESIVNGSLTSKDNLLWDAETGQVLLTGTTTEFKDPIYTTNIPGHWAYEGLAGGYKNIGLEFAPGNIVDASGAIISSPYLGLLQPGDEIGITGTSGYYKGYVDKIGNSVYLTINSVTGANATSNVLSGSSFLSYPKVKVLRSGRHNLQDQNVGSVTTFTSPLYNNPSQWPVLNQSYGVTQASAVELGNVWQGYCGCYFASGSPSPGAAYPNQYIYGIKGNYRKIKDYAFLTARVQTKQNGNSNIRVDGTFESFSPFWTPNGGNDWVPNPNSWRWVTEATRYSPYGFDLENKDALERFSAAQYGYMQTMPVAVSSNSRYKQSANESFEYNVLNFCEDDHFGYNQHRAKTYVTPPPGTYVLLQKYAHTGRRSVKVPATQTVVVTRQINPCN